MRKPKGQSAPSAAADRVSAASPAPAPAAAVTTGGEAVPADWDTSIPDGGEIPGRAGRRGRKSRAELREEAAAAERSAAQADLVQRGAAAAAAAAGDLLTDPAAAGKEFSRGLMLFSQALLLKHGSNLERIEEIGFGICVGGVVASRLILRRRQRASPSDDAVIDGTSVGTEGVREDAASV